MNRDDIIRMARETGINEATSEFYGDELEHFAALVAAAERERMKSEGWRQCAKGQRTTQFCGMLEDTVAAEREACAKVAESMRPKGGRMFNEAQSACFSALTDCAAAIRARGQA
jgi:hypothetical protein